jgi:hypothetical protein
MVAWPVSPRVGNVKNDDPEPDRSRAQRNEPA